MLGWRTKPLFKVPVHQAEVQKKHDQGREKRKDDQCKDELALDAAARPVPLILEKQLDDVTGEYEKENRDQQEVDGPHNCPEVQLPDKQAVSDRGRIEQAYAAKINQDEKGDHAGDPVDPHQRFSSFHESLVL